MAAERRYPGWVRHAGIGFELAGAIIGFAAVGYFIDRQFNSSPWGILGGVILGMVGGFYNLVKESLMAVREAEAEDKAAANDSTGNDGNGG